MKCQGFLPVINEDAKILVLGSMPSEQALKLKEYYGNKQNRFWSIVFNVFKQQEIPADYQAKVDFLKENKVALWDVLATCERIGSLDSAIKNEQINDFGSLFTYYKNIQRVCFNGQKAWQTFFKYHNNLLKEKNIDYVVLPSTSPANARYSFTELLVKWQEALLT